MGLFVAGRGGRQDERGEETQTAENKDAWIRREWLDVEPGEEAVALRDGAPEIEKIGFGLIKAHPTYERIESGGFEREELREFVKELGSVDVMMAPVL